MEVGRRQVRGRGRQQRDERWVKGGTVPVLAMSPLSSMAAYAAWTRFAALTPFFMPPRPPWPPRGDVGQLLAAL